jgi:hypothetical protein
VCGPRRPSIGSIPPIGPQEPSTCRTLVRSAPPSRCSRPPSWLFHSNAAPVGHYHLIDGLDRTDNSSGVLHDANNPAIFGKRFGPTPGKTLASITITRDANTSGNVIVFGATGVLATRAGPG